MTNLEIILLIIVWIVYGVFNTYQHDWYDDNAIEVMWFIIFLNVLLAPIALIVRIFRGIFLWKGEYE